MIHLFYGDAAVDSFSCFNNAKSSIVLRETLLTGPVTLPSESWNGMRSRYLARAFGASQEECLAELEAFDRALEAVSCDDELVCWFGRDLFCQIGLIYALVRIGALRKQQTFLVCPSDQDIYCFGDVAPADMNDLLLKREPVTELQFQQAAISWHLYSSEDPQSLNGVFDGSIDVGARFANALEQHASRFPWTSDSLGETERVILTSIRKAPLPFSELFRVVSRRTRHITWGDAQIHNMCKHLASCEPNLITMTPNIPGAEYSHDAITLTAEGARALEGRCAAITRPRRWLGGCELSGEPVWHWSPSERRLVYSGT